MFDFNGKAVLVTGGTRGIGRGIAEAFLAAGAQVAICGRTDPESLPDHQARTAQFFAADVRDATQAASAVESAYERFGRLDVLVNNAGGSPPAEAATASPRFSAAIVELNLLGALHCAQRANALMQQHDSGSIVNIASVSGQRPSPGTAAYGAAKAGLIHLTKSLAIEWAPKVRVNCVVAGMVRTELAEMHYGDEEGVAAVAATVPLGRLAEPADIAAACLFLSSDAAAYITGAELLVHGGGERPAFLAAAKTGARR